MKMKELPKAPIQIQRDELLTKIAELKKEIAEKSHTIITLQAELKSKSEVITNKDITIANLQATSILNSEAIAQKEHDIEELRNQLFELQNDVIIIGNDAIEEI
jgi:hypothetical protein